MPTTPVIAGLPATNPDGSKNSSASFGSIEAKRGSMDPLATTRGSLMKTSSPCRFAQTRGQGEVVFPATNPHPRKSRSSRGSWHSGVPCWNVHQNSRCRKWCYLKPTPSGWRGVVPVQWGCQRPKSTMSREAGSLAPRSMVGFAVSEAAIVNPWWGGYPSMILFVFNQRIFFNGHGRTELSSSPYRTTLPQADLGGALGVIYVR